MNQEQTVAQAAAEVQAMADCMHLLRTDLIEAGVVKPSVPPMFMTEAILAVIRGLRRDCAEAYQVIGAGMLLDPVAYTQEDVERALDNLNAAVNGEPRPHEDLLPWPHEALTPEQEREAALQRMADDAQELGLYDDMDMAEAKVAGYTLPGDARIDRCDRDGFPTRWAVRRGRSCLTLDGCWEYEPFPSERDEAWLERHRFSAPVQAYQAWVKATREQP